MIAPTVILGIGIGGLFILVAQAFGATRFEEFLVFVLGGILAFLVAILVSLEEE